MKLTIKHLAPYLPYGLKSKGFYPDKSVLIRPITINNIMTYVDGDINAKPILRPIIDFYEDIDGLSLSDMITHGYHNEFWWEANFDVNQLRYLDCIRLIEKHADVFGLIKEGLAIDINTL